jgi:hypothetical protein
MGDEGTRRRERTELPFSDWPSHADQKNCSRKHPPRADDSYRARARRPHQWRTSWTAGKENERSGLIRALTDSVDRPLEHRHWPTPVLANETWVQQRSQKVKLYFDGSTYKVTRPMPRIRDRAGSLVA